MTSLFSTTQNDTASTSSASGSTSSSNEYDNTLIQYIIMRYDLLKPPYKWSIGALITNGSHASVASIVNTMDDIYTQQYVAGENLQRMYKVTLQVKDEAELLSASNHLSRNKIQHHIWMEQPENIASCLASKPYPRSIIKPFLQHLKLFK